MISSSSGENNSLRGQFLYKTTGRPKNGVFRRVGTYVQNLVPKNFFFSPDELHIILKRSNLEVCEHSSFSVINGIVF